MVKTKVLRDNEIVELDSDELTIGDFVILESGDKISADMRIVEAHNFMVDESILTGESIQVSKTEGTIKKENIAINDQNNIVFSGTNVVTGRAKAIVVAIGLDTEIGKIANSINNAEETKSPLTIRVEKFSKQRYRRVFRRACRCRFYQRVAVVCAVFYNTFIGRLYFTTVNGMR